MESVDLSDIPWHERLANWQPFKIDALGLVTLLGAEEINQSLGRLVPSRYLEYFPLLGAFVVAGERFKEKKPSFNFYNITDGINTSDLSFWLTRWMLEQEFEMSRSIVHFEVADKPRSFLKWHIVSGSLSCLVMGGLLVLTILIGDWYGFANTVSMILSIVARAYSMQAHRNSIDRAVIAATKGKPVQEEKKCLIVMSDSKTVTLFLPGNLVVPVFVYNPQPLHSVTYHLIRYIGWAVFGVHILTIGMATLVPQMITVLLLVVSTVLTCWKLGCDDSRWSAKFQRRILRRAHRPVQYECWIGSCLKAYVSEWPMNAEFKYLEHEKRWTRQPSHAIMAPEERSKKRQDLYAWLNLSSDEEDSLAKWDLYPHVRNHNEDWWHTYKAKQALIKGDPVTITRKQTMVIGTKSLKDSKRPGISVSVTSTANSTDSDTMRPPPHPNTPAAAAVTQGQPEEQTDTYLTSNGFVAHPDQNLNPSTGGNRTDAIGSRNGVDEKK